MLSISNIWFPFKYSMFDILLTAAVGIFLVWYVQFLWSRRKLYVEAWKLPGPFAWPIFGSAFEIAGNFENILKNVMNLLDSYPESFRIWLGPRLYFVTSDPKKVEVLLTKCLEKDMLYKHSECLIGHGLISAPAEKWKKNRKLISPTFNQRILDGFVEVFSRQAETLSEVMETYSGKGEFDISNIVSKCTLDSICETSMGVTTDFQKTDSSFPTWINMSIETIVMRMFVLWYQSDITFKLSKYAKKQKISIQQVHEVTNKVVEEKRKAFELKQEEKLKFGVTFTEEEPRWKPFLDHLFEISHYENDYFTDRQIRDEVNTFLIAGSDTTATALCFTLTMMGLYPDLQEKVFKEVIDVLGPNRHVEHTDLVHLKYMDLFIKETLRMFPPAALFARAVKEDIDLGDFTVPKGASIFICSLKVHMNEKHWPDPFTFKPERFLPEEVVKRHPGAYIPFLYGPRNCIGQRYAGMSLKTTLCSVVRKFKIFTAIKRIEDIELKSHFTIKPVHGFKLSVELR